MSRDERAEEASSPVWQGLRFRVAALLALSLLPIGLVTMLQTRELAVEVESRAELSLLNQTTRATFNERQAIERIFGAAEALTVVLELLRDDPQACSAYLQNYIASAPKLTFVGFIPPDGVVDCSSEGTVIDFSDSERIEERMQDRRAHLDRLEDASISGRPVLNILRPALSESGAFTGYVTLSMPVEAAEMQTPLPPENTPRSLITFNRDGQTLFAEVSRQGTMPLVPRDSALADLVGAGPRVFEAADQTGRERTFSVVPIIPDLVYAIAAWPAREGLTSVAGMPLSPTILPLLMFAASIAVAYFAVDRLVVRHVSELRGMMRAFAREREVPSTRHRGALSRELRELEEGFVEMAIDLSNDEAKMEDALREKNVLLKEIHHRVKNNLQLISSIMNMQIRAAREEETVTFLRRLQERILGLSAVHRNLYQADDLSRTNAGKLLDDLFRQLLSTSPRAGDAVEFDGAFDDVVLYPDQALPLSLLASELGTNALNHVSAAKGERCTIRASLRKLGHEEAELVCENSIAPDTERSDGSSYGLGNRLIRAFAAQLGGEVRTIWTDTRHRVSLRFPIETFAHPPADY